MARISAYDDWLYRSAENEMEEEELTEEEIKELEQKEFEKELAHEYEVEEWRNK